MNASRFILHDVLCKKTSLKLEMKESINRVQEPSHCRKTIAKGLYTFLETKSNFRQEKILGKHNEL